MISMRNKLKNYWPLWRWRTQERWYRCHSLGHNSPCCCCCKYYLLFVGGFFSSLGLPKVYLSPQHYIFCLQTVACNLKYKRGWHKVTDNIFYKRYYFVVSPNHRLHLVDPILPGGVPVQINSVTQNMAAGQLSLSVSTFDILQWNIVRYHLISILILHQQFNQQFNMISITIILVNWGRGRLSHGVAGRWGEFGVACKKR